MNVSAALNAIQRAMLVQVNNVENDYIILRSQNKEAPLTEEEQEWIRAFIVLKSNITADKIIFE